MNLKDFRNHIIDDVEKTVNARAALIDQLAAVRQEQETAMERAIPYLLTSEPIPDELVAELFALLTKYMEIEEKLAKNETIK